MTGEPSTREPPAFSAPPAPREPAATPQPLSPAVLVDELAPDGPPEIEIRDVRGEDGAAAWIGSIGHRLERHAQDSSPFAVLLVEVVDIERLRRAEPAGEVSRLTSQVQDALARGLRPADSLTRERPGRYWLLAPQTDVSRRTAAGRAAGARGAILGESSWERRWRWRWASRCAQMTDSRPQRWPRTRTWGSTPLEPPVNPSIR